MLSHDQQGFGVVEAGEQGLMAGGSTGMLAAMLRAEEALPTGQANRYFRLAQLCALLGDESKSLRYLHLALERRDVNLVALTAIALYSPHPSRALVALLPFQKLHNDLSAHLRLIRDENMTRLWK